MTTANEVDVDPILSKIRKLLATAEHPNTPEHEADTAMAMAQRLISKHAIDVLLLAQKPGQKVSLEVVVRKMWLPNPYADMKSRLAYATAKANRCKSIYTQLKGGRQITVVGLSADLDAFEMAYTSLLLQLVTVSRNCGHGRADWPKTRGFDAMDTWEYRQSYQLGWIAGVSERLAEVARLAEEEAETSHGPGVGLMLIDSKRLVADKVHELFPRTKSSQVRIRNEQASQAGHAASRNADIGNKRMAGRAAIG